MIVWMSVAMADPRPTVGGQHQFDATDQIETYDVGDAVRVHYSVSGPNVTLLADDDATGVPDLVEDAGAVVADALVRFADAGFRSPVSEADLGLGAIGGSTALDVYVLDFPAGVDGSFEVDACSGAVCGGFLVVENDFVGSPYPPSIGLITVLPHELFHGVQQAYGSFEVWISEGTAVWAEQFYAPDSTDFIGLAGEYLDEPTRALDDPPIGVIQPWAYGTGLWWDHVVRRHDPTLIHELLEAWSGTDDDDADVMVEVIEARGDDIEAVWMDFAVANLATGVRAGGGVDHPYGSRLDLVVAEASGPWIDDDNRFYPLATTYYQIEITDGSLWMGFEEAAADVTFSLHPTTSGQWLGPVLPAVATFDGADPLPHWVTDLDEGQYWLVGAQPRHAGSSVKVRFCAGSEADVTACFVPGDTGGTPDPPTPGGDPVEGDPPGCGCGHAPAGIWGPFGLYGLYGLFGLGGLVRHRRRNTDT